MNLKMIGFIIGLASGYCAPLWAPDVDMPKQPGQEEWQAYINQPSPKKELNIKVLGDLVICNGVEIKHSQKPVQTVVTVEQELYINGERVEVPADHVDRSKHSASQRSECAIQ